MFRKFLKVGLITIGLLISSALLCILMLASLPARIAVKKSVWNAVDFLIYDV